MAAFNFPNSPSTNDLHTENGVTYKWNGTVWKRQNASYTDATNLNVTGIATFANNVSIGGTLTYEDVKNVDSVGIVTARTGIHIDDSITHIGDTNTKIRFPAADTITAETAGSERVRITSDGNLGLGINSPVARLHVHNSGTGSGDHAYAYFTTGDTGSDASSGLTVGVAANQVASVSYREAGALSLGTNSTERLRITSTGVVSINDSTPETWATLQVNNHSTHDAAQILIRGADQAQIILRDDTGGTNTKCTTIRNDQGALIFGTHNDNFSGFSEKLTITSAGAIQCKGETDVQNSILRVTDSTPRIIMSVPSGGLDTRLFNDGSGNFIIGHGTNSDTPTERLRITSAGKMGLGTGNNDPVGGDFVIENTTGTAGVALSRVFSGNVASSAVNTPSFAFTMSDTATNDQVVASISPQALAGTGDAFKGHIRVFTANTAGTNTERLRITSDGDIQVDNGNVHIDDNGEFAIFEQDTARAMTNSSKISMDFASNVARIRSSHNGSGGNAVSRPLGFYIGSSEKVRIDSSGSLLIGSSSNNGASNAGQTPVLYANGYSNLGGLRIKGGDDGNTIYKDGGDLCLVTASAHSIILKTAGGEQIKANNDGRVITTTNQSVVGLLVKNSSHDSRLQIYAEAANKNSTIWFGDAADDDIGIIDYDHNDNSMSFTTNTNERVRIASSGVVEVKGAANDTALVQLQDNNIGGVRVAVNDEAISSAIYLPRDGAMVLITGFSNPDVNGTNYPQPSVSGMVYVDCGPSRNIKVADLGSNVGYNIVAKTAYTGTVSNCDNNKLTVMGGNTEGTFRLVNRIGTDKYLFCITML